MEFGRQELDETAYWMELLIESKAVAAPRVAQLQEETQQLLAIFVASVTTCKKNKKR